MTERLCPAPCSLPPDALGTPDFKNKTYIYGCHNRLRATEQADI